ncbi:MAG: N-6 DNA methylase [Rikenellaceae bacterium]
MAKKTIQSIEPNIADLANGWLKQYDLDYKLEQQSLNSEIDKALHDYFSKNGGTGANRPDAKLLLQDDQLNYYPILIEYKGYKNKLVKLDANGQVENKNKKNEHNFNNINSYAVNGAIHYANAILHHTSYTEIIAIGMTGYMDESGKIQHEIGVYYVSKKNFGIGQKVADYSDLSFLAPNNFNAFIERVKSLNLPQEEADRLRDQREKEIDKVLKDLNNHIFENEKGIDEKDRVYLVAASIIATIGIPNKVKPLESDDLKSSIEEDNTDGDIITRKVKAFLEHKGLPKDKKDLIVRTLQNTLTTENINKVEDGESQLKRVFTKIVDDLGIYYKIGLTTDFTGKLFNEMYGWLGFSQDKLNDVVLTPSYVATLLVKLARVNKDSYVWDFATGSAGLLVAAMNEMLKDAKDKIISPKDLREKELQIKAEQLLGLELLPSVYMLAILNMILMGDGSSNILNKDSLKDFDGNYGFGKTDEKFPADAFILNPPYSANGNGMNFVERALNMMVKGYAAIIIQNTAGSGKASEYNRRILKEHTLVASIKMPADIFIGKSSVQTYIYVFKVKEAHQEKDVVKFIDFSNDGYTRTSRKKASINLKDTNNAKERYEELVNLVRFGAGQLKLFTSKEYYEGTIDPKNGADWNQSAPVDSKPTLDDFNKTVSDFLAWEISNLIRQEEPKDDEEETQDEVQDVEPESIKEPSIEDQLKEVEWNEFRLDDLFVKIKVPSMRYKASELPSRPEGDFVLPALTAGIQNQGLNNYVPKEGAVILKNAISISANGANTGVTFYQNKEFTVLQDAYAISWKNTSDKLTENHYLFLTNSISKTIFGNYEWTNKAGWERIKSEKIQLPVKGKKIDFAFMDSFIACIEEERMKRLEDYLAKLKEKNNIVD